MLISKKSILKILLVGFLAWNVNPCQAAFSSFVDLLMWNASEETSSIWSNITTVPSNNTRDLRVQNINFDWDLGLRIGFSYDPKQAYWDSRLYWTYFSTDKKMQLPPYGQVISPGFFSSFLSLDSFFGVNFEWRIALNMLDYNISHEFSLSDKVRLRPSIGLKAGTIHQNIHVNWD